MSKKKKAKAPALKPRDPFAKAMHTDPAFRPKTIKLKNKVLDRNKKHKKI